MNLQSIGFSGAQQLVANATYSLTTPTIINQRSVYRRVFGLRINTGGLADTIRFDKSAAHLTVEFSARQFDIAGTSGVKVNAKGQALTIELPVPLQIRRARVSGTTTSTVEIYRLDGDEVAGDPTKKIANSTSSSVSGDFTDRRLALKLKKPDGNYDSLSTGDLKDLVVQGFPTAPRAGIAPVEAGADNPFFFFNPGGIVGQENGPSGSADIGPQLADALQQHIDSIDGAFPDHIDIFLVFESDAPCDVVAKSFAIPVALARTTFRAVLFQPEDFTDAVSFATRLQEHGTQLTAFLRNKLSANTRALIDRIEKNVPAPVLGALARDLNASLQSEAWYTAQRFQGVTLAPDTLAAAQTNPTGVARARMNRKLLEEAFPNEIAPIPEPDDDEKKVLKAGGAASVLDLSVDFPRAAIISSAAITLEGDLRGDAPGAANGNGSGPSNGDWPDAIPDVVGLSVDTTRSVARFLSLDSAVAASGVALALSSTAKSAELTAEIRADERGAPAGRVIASGRTTIDQLDQPSWIHFAFKKSTVVEAKPHWLVLRATNGSAVWLAESESAQTRVGDSLEKGWNDRGSFETIAPLFQVWSRAGEAAESSNADDSLAARMRVTIGGVSVTPAASADAGKTRVANIAAALQAWLSAQPAGPEIIAVPIRVSALGKGSVTVYPPSIEYTVF